MLPICDQATGKKITHIPAMILSATMRTVEKREEKPKEAKNLEQDLLRLVVLAGFLSTFVSVGPAIYSFDLFIVPMSAGLASSLTSISVALTLFIVSMGVVGIYVDKQVALDRVRKLVLVGMVLTEGG